MPTLSPGWMYCAASCASVMSVDSTGHVTRLMPLLSQPGGALSVARLLGRVRAGLLRGDLATDLVHVELADLADDVVQGLGRQGAGLGVQQDAVAERHQRRNRRDLD